MNLSESFHQGDIGATSKQIRRRRRRISETATAAAESRLGVVTKKRRWSKHK
jgi:hypothetical protein